MTLGGSAGDFLAQVQQWYADPVRELPRKVVSDVARLLKIVEANDAEIDRLRAALHAVKESSNSRAARVAQLEGVVGWARTLMNAKSGSGTDIAAEMLRQALAALGDQ